MNIEERSDLNHRRSLPSWLVVGVVLVVVLPIILTGNVDEVLGTLADFTLRHGG